MSRDKDYGPEFLAAPTSAGEIERSGHTVSVDSEQDLLDAYSRAVVSVVAVEENGPARRAGLEVGDLIVELNGQAITTVDDIHRLLSRQLAGSTLKLVILRGTERRGVEIVFEWLGKDDKR